ncbi:MAG: putative diguanylate cyclase [Euryarchaeota archaeon ADurb.Bin294]|nr:MAG: putative diguanylate cyclase [Euryarchaeota archaeon ADurb.Bin294]
MHGYHDRSEVIGHHFSMTQVDTSQEAAQKNFERLLSGEPIPSGEFTRRCRDGTTGIHSFSAIPVMENGEITGIEGFLIDITNRKMIEDDLKRSEQEYWWLLESMINAFVMFESVFDKEGRFVSYRFLYINKVYEEITGVRLHDVYGKTVHEVWPDTEDEWIQRYGEVAFTGIPSEFDLFHAPTKKTYHCHVYRPWNDTRRFCVIFEDITERKRAEETLQESRDLLDATQKLTRIGGWEWHVQRQSMTWTTETYQIHDIDPGSITPGSPEHITKSISCYDPEDRPVIKAAFERCVNEGIPYDLVFPFTTMKGRRIWIRTTAEPVLADGKVIRVIGNIMDITDQKLAEAALHESQEKYRLIAENTADNIWIIGMDLKMQYSSPSVWKMKGFTVEETLAQSITDMMTPASVEKVLKLFYDEMEAELAGTADPNRTISFDTEEYCKDGSVIIVENSATLIRDEQGRPIGILGISRDITERKKMQDALMQSNKKLRLLTSLTRHDILNLISSVNGFLDLANSEDDPEKARYYLSRCKEAGERMEVTIGFTREYEDFGVISSGWVNVSMLIRSAQTEIASQDIRIESHISPTLEIFADPIIRKVFSTLIENSLRHGERTSCIRFSEIQRNGDCIIVCEDDGIGIPVAEKEYIFEHGFGKHTGIGLFLSREILSITGLSICECGEEGKGARFEITVPVGKFRINAKTGL